MLKKLIWVSSNYILLSYIVKVNRYYRYITFFRLFQLLKIIYELGPLISVLTQLTSFRLASKSILINFFFWNLILSNNDSLNW